MSPSFPCFAAFGASPGMSPGITTALPTLTRRTSDISLSELSVDERVQVRVPNLENALPTQLFAPNHSYPPYE